MARALCGLCGPARPLLCWLCVTLIARVSLKENSCGFYSSTAYRGLGCQVCTRLQQTSPREPPRPRAGAGLGLSCSPLRAGGCGGGSNDAKAAPAQATWRTHLPALRPRQWEPGVPAAPGTAGTGRCLGPAAEPLCGPQGSPRAPGGSAGRVSRRPTTPSRQRGGRSPLSTVLLADRQLPVRTGQW